MELFYLERETIDVDELMSPFLSYFYFEIILSSYIVNNVLFKEETLKLMLPQQKMAILGPFFETLTIPPEWGITNLVLIPKVAHLEMINQFARLVYEIRFINWYPESSYSG